MASHVCLMTARSRNWFRSFEFSSKIASVGLGKSYFRTIFIDEIGCFVHVWWRAIQLFWGKSSSASKAFFLFRVDIDKRVDFIRVCWVKKEFTCRLSLQTLSRIRPSCSWKDLTPLIKGCIGGKLLFVHICSRPGRFCGHKIVYSLWIADFAE